MKATALILLLTLVSAVSGGLAPPERAYKILMLLSVSTKSHRNVFMPIAEALADRGHKIVMLVNHPPASRHPNIEEIDHGLPEFRGENKNMFETRSKSVGSFSISETALLIMARKLYKLPKVISLYEIRKDFDLIIINHLFNEITYPFAHEMPFITIATCDHDSRQSAVLGNVFNPAYAPTLMKDYPRPMSMVDRFRNTLEHIVFGIYWRHWTVIPLVQKEISALFPDLPPLLDIERNQSLTLMNSHFSLGVTLPLLPSQVELGALHCRPGRPLAEDLESFLSGASEGVVYFSLGSFTQGHTMPTVHRNMFIEAFRKLKQRVLWKFEMELDGIPENVVLRNWLPQQDVLAHPNVKLFITHGGSLSLQETVYHGKPVIVLPIYGDQPRNAVNAQNKGLGVVLVWEELTADLIFKSIREVLDNSKYKANVEALQAPLRDQLESPKDRAVFWTEYVIRHKGAPQLISPAAQLSWVEYLMLDVLLVLHLVLYLIFSLLRCVTSALWGKVFWTKTKQESKKKRE